MPNLLPNWKSDDINDINGFLKDATSYLIAAQVGLLAVVSVAVGLVTLIAQRDDGSSTSTDIQLYYNGALAYEVVASSVALLLVLCVQIFWPLDYAIRASSYDRAELVVKVILTALHLLWLAVNIGAFAQFVAMSLRFVEPKARENMREQYTANVIVPDDLRRRILPWLYATSPKTLLPESEADTGPLIAFGHSLANSGEVEISVNLFEQSMLWDVRVWPLGVAIRRWWRRVEAAGLPDRRRSAVLGRSISLALTPSFGFAEHGERVWCRRSGGVALTAWEKRLIRYSFKYRRAKWGERVLPSPGNFIEELADKVIVQIDRLATTGFNAALDELVRYHNFLLEVYASHSGDGQPLSLAQFGGWEQPHQGWTRQYRRVFERAVDHLVEDPVFFETMAHVPTRLLPENPAEHPAAVLEAILDMGPLQVIFLEAWVTRRTTVAVAGGTPAQPRLALAGSDQRAYEEVVLRVIGAWERLTRVVDQLYRWRDTRNDPDRLWKAYRSSWPYLERHVRNTAYFLVTAVWNEDAFGSERYRDMLLRWLGTFRLQPTLDYTLRHHRLLTPDLLKIDWPDTVERLIPYRRGPVGPAPAPQALFDTIVQRAFDDVVVLTAAVTLTWYLQDQQASDVGGQTAERLIRGEVIAEEGARVQRPRARVGDSFERIFAIIIREDLVTRLGPGRYGTRLDDLVRYLSQMSERRVVPGRIYTSWGLHGVDTVAPAILVMLLANLLDEGDNRLVDGIGEIAANEELFVDRDEALSRMFFDIDQLGTKLVDQANQAVLARGFQLLAPDRDFAAAVVRLQAILTAAKDVISLRRLDRLKARPPDPEKLGKLRGDLEHTIGGVEGQLPIFRGFHVGHATTPPQQTDRGQIGGIDKGELVTPPLSPERTGLFDTVVEWFTEYRGDLVWHSFCRRKRRRVQIAPSRYPLGFWKKVIELAAEFGTDAVLVVPFDRIGDDMSTWTIRQPDELTALRIEYRQNQPTGGGFGYTGTIEGINVYTARFPPDCAWLFSARSLQSIRYARLSSGNLIDLAFKQGDNPRASTFDVSFAQEVEWNDSPIIEVVLRSRAALKPATRAEL